MSTHPSEHTDASGPAEPLDDDDLAAAERVAADPAAAPVMASHVRRYDDARRALAEVAQGSAEPSAELGHEGQPQVLVDWQHRQVEQSQRREWAAALRWASTGADETEVHWRPWLWQLADRIEAGALTPWADQPEPADEGTWSGRDLAAVKTLIDHQRRDIGHCICGWGANEGNLGQSHALHVWRELQRAVPSLAALTGEDAR